ncbi:MAG: HNH endonuclease [Candidatus Anammoxibacter sp.]
MCDWIHIDRDPKHIAREKTKAKELKKTQWWRDKLNQGTCHYCKKKYDHEDITMDHVVPMARGGKSTRSNIVPCCRDCNSAKKYLTPAEIVLNKLREGIEETD